MPEAMILIVELATALGVTAINTLPGCWYHRLDENWEFAVNGHNEPRKWQDIEIGPFTAYLQWNGFPAGLIGLGGGTMAAGSAANEDALCEALKKAIAAASSPEPLRVREFHA